jgi:TolB-like protein
MPRQLFAFGPFVFDSRRGTLFRGASPVVIGRRERALLHALLEADGEVVTKSSLMDAAWPKTIVEESNLTVQIAALRRSIGLSTTGENWIATIPGVGYRLVHSTPVRQRDAEAVEAPAAQDETEPRPTIAVLPFTNMSSDPEQEYFGDGLAEDLITDLSRIPGFVVIARHSSFAYKGNPVDIRTIAKDLGVRYVIEGSVRRDADRVRISAQIIDAIANIHLWANRFDRDLESVFTLQDEIIAKIVSAFSGLVPTTRPMPRQRATSLEAYDLFVRGRTLVNQSVEGNRPTVLHGSVGERTEPTRACRLGDTDAFRASKLKLPIQGMNCNGNFSRATPIRSRTQGVSDHSFQPADGSLYEGAPRVPRPLLPAHASMLRDALEVPVALGWSGLHIVAQHRR